MAETDTHACLIMDLRIELENFFRDDPEVYVSGNLLLYYIESNPQQSVAPDVFVVRGVGKGARRVYKLWEEGCAPHIVFEISSRHTWRDDWHKKWRLYEQIGVKEYFIFDPEYDYLPEPLIGWRLEAGQLVPIEIAGGRVRSEVLELELVDTGETLRLFDPQTGKYLLTPAEEAEALRKAEAELAQLREELERFRQSKPSE